MIKFCSLYSGSSGNALFISYRETRLLIDAGVSGIRIQKALESIGENPADLSAIIVTHEHNDHINCVGIMSRRFSLPVYANKKTWKRMAGSIGEISGANIMYFASNKDFQIKDIKIHPFSVPHDAMDPVGFSFYANGKKVTIATDIGHMNDFLLENIEDSDLLMLESNHDIDMLESGNYPYSLKKRIKSECGHLCNSVAGETLALLAKRGISRFIIGHLSRENNCPEVAYRTVLSYINENGFSVGEGIELYVAERNTVSKVFEI